MDARFVLRKETKEKLEKGMNSRNKGKILFTRLRELDADGTLSKAKTRADVAKLVGYSEERAKAGYAWVSNLISHGYIRETILEWSPNGKRVAEYHTTDSTPDYDYDSLKSKRKKNEKAGQELRRWQDKVAAGQIPQAPEPQEAQVHNEEQVASDAKTIAPIKIEITRGDITVKVETDNYEQASKLIMTIMKGD